MKPALVVHVVKHGSLAVEVREYSRGRFGFDFTPPGAERRQVRLKGLEAAIKRAEDMIGVAKAGRVARMAIDEDEYTEYLQWRSQRVRRASVPDLVKSFIKAKANKGRSMHHMRQLKGDLEAFAKSFTGLIDRLTREEIEEWLDARKVGPRRWNNLREAVVSLHRFARREGALSTQLSGAELIERRRVTLTVETYTPEELERIIAVVPHEWLPAIIFGAFCGLRPQELCPEPRSGKPGLTWGNVLWAKGKIDVPAAVSKTRRRRFAPLTLPAIAFLEDRKGMDPGKPVCPAEQINKQTIKWGEDSKVGWRSDALRHSFASYRLAIIKDMQALALEMGNSPAMIFRHYLDLKHDEEGEEWFALRPKVEPKNIIRLA